MKTISLSALYLVVCTLAACAVGHDSPTRIALLGDSMTWIGGDSCRNPRGWTHTFRRLNPNATIDTYARSGATWTNTPSTKGDTTEYSEILTDENVIYNQVKRLSGRVERNEIAPPDVIIIYAGANDAWFSARRPGIFDPADSATVRTDASNPSEVCSLFGSVILSCRELREKVPDAQIFLVGPAEMSKVSSEQTSKVAEIIAAAADSLGLPMLRPDIDLPIRHSEEKKKLHYTSDGVHTNPEGARLIGEYISSRVRR